MLVVEGDRWADSLGGVKPGPELNYEVGDKGVMAKRRSTPECVKRDVEGG